MNKTNILKKFIKIYKGKNPEIENREEMMSKCVYCKIEIVDNRAIDICDPCGHGVWGPKMFGAVKSNTGSARDKGDLYQGSVTSIKQNF